MRKLLVWDIDGTLVKKRNGADREFSKAIAEVLELPEGKAPEQIDGDTDYTIIVQMLGDAGVSRADAIKLMPQVIKVLEKISCAHDYIRARRQLLPGAEEALAAARKESLLQTYGTGNTPYRARAKTGALGIGKYLDFSIGGFGDWTPFRAELIGRVRTLAALAYGHQYPGKQMIVIGDTPKDIAAAQASGARSVAVATGVFSLDELVKCQPDVLLEDLSGDPLPQILG